MTNEWMVIGDTKPCGWSEQWHFPRYFAFPPGFPKDFKMFNIRFAAECFDNKLILRIFDQYDEPCDVMDGMYVQLIAGTTDSDIRLKKRDDENWCEGGLVQINGSKAEASLEFDKERAGDNEIRLELSLYAFKNSPTIHVGVN